MELFDTMILKTISRKLLQRKETIAVGESVTSGLLQFAFSNAPDGASFFQGGITAYNIAQKYKFLQVEPIHALGVNCVSEKVADEMAIHICKLFSSDWGIGLTGYATPVPESDQKIYAFYSIVYQGEIKVKSKVSGDKKDPIDQQLTYCSVILSELMKALNG
ncbi:MAG: CinA domain protein [Chitinophagaceae bacterium]|nr:CinA domain protein [Chitinophagaceae bacterium]